MRSTMYTKALLARTGVRKISSVACWFSPIKSLFTDYPSLISRKNEVYVFFNKISLKQYFIEKNTPTSFLTVCLLQSHLLCVCMISVTTASRYVTSASRN